LQFQPVKVAGSASNRITKATAPVTKSLSDGVGIHNHPLRQLKEATMALIQCPECSKEISDQANNCPNCGYSQKTETNEKPSKKYIRKKLNFIFLLNSSCCGNVL